MDQLIIRNTPFNQQITFLISEAQFNKIENYSSYLNISTENNKELGLEAFHMKSKGQSTK